jgi:predicted MFS family arabinose efflux permease
VTMGRIMYIFVLAFCAFATSLSAKSIDPLIIPIAGDFLVPVAMAALLAGAYAFSYCSAQLVLGP